MAKRFTDTEIWKNQRWFKKLSPVYKLAWKYLTDTCDHAGIWKIDYGQITEDLGIEDFDFDDFLQNCNADFDPKTGKKIKRERIIIIKKHNVILLTQFIQFQYEGKDFTVSPKVPVIKSALTILKGYETLTEGLDKGWLTLTEPS